jgi:hypothetical protein
VHHYITLSQKKMTALIEGNSRKSSVYFLSAIGSSFCLTFFLFGGVVVNQFKHASYCSAYVPSSSGRQKIMFTITTYQDPL